MNVYVIPVAATPSLTVAGASAYVPIRRIFCVARNYWRDASQSRTAADRETPFFFMKPADALVAAEEGAKAFAVSAPSTALVPAHIAGHPESGGIDGIGQFSLSITHR